MYLLFLWATGLITFGAAWVAYKYSRDSFHPLMFLGPMLAFPYFITPLLLRDSGVTTQLLPKASLPFVQAYYFVAIAFLVIGVLSVGRPKQAASRPSWNFTPRVRRRLRNTGIFLGTVGAIAYLYMVENAGGFSVAYGVAHGHGWASSGYIRDAMFLTIPGVLFFMLSRSGCRWRRRDWAWIGLMSAPLLFHGIVGGWRGWTFAIVATLGVAWYMIRFRRPRASVFLAAGIGLAILTLVLVVNRSFLALGSHGAQFRGMQAIERFISRDTHGNEYLYGSGVVIDAADRSAYQWGGRYVLEIGVRAIPSALWPNEYKAVANFLGISQYGGEIPTLGWSPTSGASMGLLADMWKQFWWLGLVVLFLIGRTYGLVWRKSVARGGLWVVLYVTMVAFSLYLTQQTFQAFLWRVMLLSGISWLAWRFFIYRTGQRGPRRFSRPSTIIHATANSARGA